VRLQWWGLYHDKPKVGTFMLRIKLPSGHLTPAKLRAIGEVANSGAHDRRRLRRHRPEHHRLPGAGDRPARALRLLRRRRGGGTVLLRQPRLRRPAAEAQRAEIKLLRVAHGRTPSTPAAAIASGTLPEQRVVVAPLDEIAAAAAEPESPVLLVVGEVVSLARQTAARSLAIAAGGAPAASRASSAAPRTGGAVTAMGLATGARSASRATTSS